MVAVEAAEEEVLPLLAGREEQLGLAAVNGPRAVVLSGLAEAVDEVAAVLAARGAGPSGCGSPGRSTRR